MIYETGLVLNFARQFVQTSLCVLRKTACGARRNLRAVAAAMLDFFRPLRFPRLASSAPGGNPQRSQVRVGEPLWRRKARQPRSPLKTLHRSVFLTLLQVLLI